MQDFLEFKGKGFWLDGFQLNVWMRIVCLELDRESELPEWLREARDAWKAQTRRWGNMLELELDRWLVDPARTERLAREMRRIVERYETMNSGAHGEEVKRLFTHTLGLPRFSFLGDEEAARIGLREVTGVGRAFGELLVGKVVFDLRERQGILTEKGVVEMGVV